MGHPVFHNICWLQIYCEFPKVEFRASSSNTKPSCLWHLDSQPMVSEICFDFNKCLFNLPFRYLHISLWCFKGEGEELGATSGLLDQHGLHHGECYGQDKDQEIQGEWVPACQSLIRFPQLVSSLGTNNGTPELIKIFGIFHSLTQLLDFRTHRHIFSMWLYQSCLSDA